jgi:predicted PurR-regulated permease PerM
MAPVALGLLLLPFAGRLRNAGKRFRRATPLLLLLVAVMVVITGIGGCGANNIVGQTQQAQTYTVTLIGTSGTLSQSTTVKLTVG